MKTQPTKFITFFLDEDDLFKFAASKDFTFPSEETMNEMVQIMSKVFLESERLRQANEILEQVKE